MMHRHLRQFRQKWQTTLHAQAVVANFLPVAVTSVSIFGLFCALFLLQLRMFEKELELRARSLAESVSHQSELAALLSDTSELERIARGLLAVEGVLYVRVNTEGSSAEVTVTRDSFPKADIPQRPNGFNGEALMFQGQTSRLRIVDVMSRIEQQDKQKLLDWEDPTAANAKLGTVRIGLSMQNHHLLYRRSVWGGAALAALSLVLILGVQFFQMRRILAPLKSLTDFAKHVARGDLAQRAPVVRPDEVGQLAVTCNEMVSALEKSRSDLMEALDHAQESSRLKSQFLANMSHEIRTPLNGVIGMTELALDSALKSETREQLSTALNSAQTLLRILNDILDLSKIEAGKLDLDSVEFDIEAEIEQAAKNLSTLAHLKGLEITCEIERDVPQWVTGDPYRLRQVITNLIGNAVKFTSDGEVNVRVALHSCSSTQIALRFTVTDSGIGIPVEKQAAIFDPFTQADGSTTRRYGGTGLGLAICGRLVTMMGGEIGVDSKVGVGSTFHFTAMFTPAANSREKMISLDEEVLRDLRTLVVDDNATNRQILLSVLANWRMDVETVESGAEAIATLRRASAEDRPFGLVILDAMMPEMDGFEVARRIQQDLCDSSPTVMMLSSSGFSEGERCRALGIHRYVIKPVGRKELKATVLSALGHEIETAPSDSEGSSDRQTSVLSILVAEDNSVNRKVIETLLRKAGHTVQLTCDGRAALEAWSQQPFDLILMDVQMPEMDGFEATREIRKREKGSGRHIPIIALTAHALKGDREQCIAAGMDDYVSKPVSSRELLGTIQAIEGIRT